MTYKVHPHERLMRKWLDGSGIQVQNEYDKLWVDVELPTWQPHLNYRVKPKGPVNIVRYAYTYCSFVGLRTTPMLHYVPCELENANIKLTYNPKGALIDVSKV